MSWDLIFWLITFAINVALLASTFYQYLCLTDLEADYINIYDTSSRINALVVPDFVLQGVFCAIFLVTWHWFMFLITVPITWYQIKLYMGRQHLIDVTEAFRFLKSEKNYRIVKLCFYTSLLLIVVIRLAISGFNALVDEDEVIHLF